MFCSRGTPSESHGQNPVVTVLYAPSVLDSSGHGPQVPALPPPPAPAVSAEREQLHKFLRTLNRKPRPESRLNCLMSAELTRRTARFFTWVNLPRLHDLIAASIYDPCSIGPSFRSICTRCFFTKTNTIQVCISLHWARVFIQNTRPDEIIVRRTFPHAGHHGPLSSQDATTLKRLRTFVSKARLESARVSQLTFFGGDLPPFGYFLRV